MNETIEQSVLQDPCTRLLPSPRQLAFLDWEMGAFFHFGIRTFYEGHRDWDGRPMPAAGFAPTSLDCGQWIRAIKAAGCRYAILTCKHHDGFANWPTRSSDYSVASTPWQNGRGDVVRDFTEACRAYGIKVGLYYSPADAAMKAGNRSAREHDDFFISQITELLSNYGQIDYLWFDGCGSEGHTYDTARIVGVMRALQPDLTIFGMWDHDVRWVGNEEGFAPFADNLVVTYPKGDQHFPHLDAEVRRFLPSECDFRLRARNWFFSDCDEQTIKPVRELMGIYDLSVGRGSNFLINVPPDRRGLLPEADVQRLQEFGQALRRRFAEPLPLKAAEKDGVLTLELATPALCDTLVLAEDLAGGQQVESFEVYFLSGRCDYVPPVKLFTGETVGHKRIITLPPVFARGFEIRYQARPAAGAACFRQASLYLSR